MLKRFLGDRSGNYAMLLAIATLPLVLAIGFGVDTARYISAKQHLQELADSASLAVAAATERDDGKLRTLAQDMVSGNKADNRIDDVTVAALDIDGDNVDLSLDGSIPTYFMGLANVPRLDVQASALAVRAVTGSVEVALVLDNTESMTYDNKIGTLKTAATNLVEELHRSEDADVRIALVPYAEQINVGLKNRNASWLSVPADHVQTTTNPGYWRQPTKKTDVCLEWREAGSKQVEKDGVWVTESWKSGCARYQYVNDGDRVWVPESTTTTKYAWYGCVGSRVAGGKPVLDDQSPSVPYPGYLATRQKCLTEIIPLTSDKAAIKKGISDMVTSRSGYVPQTYIPGGMMWGINVLSRTEPFSEGLGYDPANANPRKVIVLMTDGLNTMRVNTTGLANTDYLKSGAFVGDTAPANADERIQTNTDTTTLCTYAKAYNIEVFTVAFKVDDATAKAMLQECASDASHYYDASDSGKLISSFQEIARSLSQVRLAR